MSHVVPGNLEASAEASHQAGVQSPETAEFDGCRYPEFLGRRFHVPVKKVMPVERLANLVGKDQVVRLTKLLVARPHSLHCRENDTMFVERHLTLAGFSLHIVELIVVNTFIYNDAIAKDNLMQWYRPCRLHPLDSRSGELGLTFLAIIQRGTSEFRLNQPSCTGCCSDLADPEFKDKSE